MGADAPPLAAFPWDVAPVSIAILPTRACVALEDGRVACWGADARSVLGPDVPGGCLSRATSPDRPLVLVPTPTLVEGVSDAVEVAVAIETSCARTRGGEVLCWGRSPDPSCELSAPRLVPGVTDVVQLRASAGYEGFCAVLGDGTVTCWTMTRPPTVVPGLTGVRDFAMGCAIVADDRVRCFSATADDPRIRDYVVSDAQAIASVGDGFCVLDSRGTVRCLEAATRPFGGAGEPADLLGLPPVSGVVLGDSENACAWSAEGEVFCVGTGERGQLGVGTTDAHRAPVRVLGIDDAIEVVMTGGYACALRRSGGVACWGTGWLGNEPLYHYASVEVAGVDTAVRGSAYGRSSCAIDDAGALRCWGVPNGRGVSLVPTLVPTRAPVREACGAWCVLLTDGTIECPNGAPFHPTLRALESVEHLTCGGSSACVIVGGVVQCEGFDSSGMLGDGRVENTARAGDPLVGVEDVVEISAGRQHTCARTATGDVYCWGDNRNGQVGGTADAVLVPYLAARGADRLIAGGDMTCVARAGAWSCWGSLSVLSSLCDEPCGIPITSRTEVRLPFAATSLHVSSDLLCVAPPVGPVRCAGWETQIEGYSHGASPIVRSMAGTEDTVDLVGADLHACAVRSDGTMRCWGHNDWGQLGGAAAGSHPVPVPVPSPR